MNCKEIRFKKWHQKTEYTVWAVNGNREIAFEVIIEHDQRTQGRGKWDSWVDGIHIGVARSETDIKIKIQIHVRHLLRVRD